MISHKKGRERGRQIQTDAQTERPTDGIKNGGAGGCLTVAGSSTVSVLVGNHLCPLAVLSGPESQLLLNGVRSVSPSRCSPVTSTKVHKSRYTRERHSHMVTNEAKMANIYVFGHKSYNAYTNLEIKKTHFDSHTHTHTLR